MIWEGRTRLAIAPGQHQPRDWSGNAEADEADRIEAVRFALDLHAGRRGAQTRLIVRAQDDHPLLRDDVGQREMMSVGMHETSLTLDGEAVPGVLDAKHDAGNVVFESHH